MSQILVFEWLLLTLFLSQKDQCIVWPYNQILHQHFSNEAWTPFFLTRQSVALNTQSTQLTISLGVTPQRHPARGTAPHHLKVTFSFSFEGWWARPESVSALPVSLERWWGEPLPFNNWYQMLPSHKGADPWADEVPGHLTAELEDRQTAVFCQPAPAEDPPPPCEQRGKFWWKKIKKTEYQLCSRQTLMNMLRDFKSPIHFNPLVIVCFK